MRRLGNQKLLESLMPEWSRYKPGVRLAVAMVALASLVFALARPWGGVSNQSTTREGMEIVIAVDASNSMLASATADETGTDRMRTSKLMLEKLINRLANDKVGLIAYAGDAYTLIPVTNDYVSAKAFLNSLDPSLIPHQGTNIGAAVSLAERSFSDRKDIGRSIILLTDAEELENPAGTIEEVSRAAKRGIQTNVIGIGSAPVTIPSESHGRMVDEETGEVVRSALNEDLALEIAKAGNGIYVNAANTDAIDELAKQLGKLKRAAMESSFLVTHDELYFPFAILAIVLLIVDFFLTDKKNRWLDKINFFHRGKALPMIVLLLLTCAESCHKEQPAADSGDNAAALSRQARLDSLKTVYSYPEERNFILRGNNFYNSGLLEPADSNFNAALQKNGRSVVAHLNAGLATVRKIVAMEMASEQGQLSDSVMGPLIQNAMAHFEAAASPKVEKGNVSSKAFYNQGNISFTQQQYDAAIAQYKEALRLNPDDDQARRNLRIAQLQKKDNNQNQQQQQQQQQNQDQQQQNQDQEQQQNQDRRQMNEQTSQQILDAAERNENIRRTQMQTQKQESTEKSGRSTKKW